MDLFSRGPYQTVKPVKPLGPVVQAEQCIFFPLLSVKHGAVPGPQAGLDLLHVFFGPPESSLQITDRVSHLLNILPNTWRVIDDENGQPKARRIDHF